jgi:hypothetical protein
MAFKDGAILGPVVINNSGSSATNIGSSPSTGITAIGGGNSGMVTIDCGVSGINIGTTANAHTVVAASPDGSAVIQGGSGGIGVESSGGDMYLNADTISFSSDNAATSVSIANAAASKSVTIGNTTSTTSIALKFGTGDFSLSSATGTIIRSLDTGETTMPLQSAFLARKTTDQLNATGTGTTVKVGYDTEVFDQNSDYDGVDTFTAPVNGRYCFGASVRFEQVGSTSTSYNGYFKTTDRDVYFDAMNIGKCYSFTDSYTSSGTVFTEMDAGDTCYVSVSISGMAGDTADVSWGVYKSMLFSGFLVC